MSILSVKEIDAFYGEFQALFGVSLEVEPGQIVSVIGANGAGKTTLMKTITGQVVPPHGQIIYQKGSIKGRSVHALTKLGISMVPEGRKIFPSLNVSENLLIGNYSQRKGYWNLEKVYGLFPLLRERASYPGIDLSGGQQQMLAIGRSLMNNPDLLLMDEISLGLAPIIVKELYAAMPQITAAGTTILLVEQDVSRSLQVADRVYCLLEGRVSLQGQPTMLGPEQISRAYFGV